MLQRKCLRKVHFKKPSKQNLPVLISMRKVGATLAVKME